MVAIPVSQGSGSTAYLPLLASQMPGAPAGGRMPWSLAAANSYSRPASIMYRDFQTASASNQQIIQQALMKARMEAERRRRELEQQRQAMAAEGGFYKRPEEPANWQQMNAGYQNAMSTLPTPGVMYDENGNPLPPGSTQPGVPAPIPPEGYTPPGVPTGFQRSQSPLDYIKARIWAVNEPGSVVQNQTGFYTNAEKIPEMVQAGAASLDDEIAALERNYDQRRYQAAVETWGRPAIREYQDNVTLPSGAVVPGETKYWLDWGAGAAEGWAPPVQYLGVAPGYVAGKPAPPPKNASLEEKIAYRDRMKRSIRPPLYQEKDVIETLNAMGSKGLAQLQKSWLKAGIYATDDVVKLGVFGEKEIGYLRTMMEEGNLNGLKWEDINSLYLQAGAQRQAAGGGGYGGGGGGGGGTTVYKQIQYTQTSVAQARSMLVSVLTEALGRYPTDGEVQRFLELLNKAENKSPTKTVTRTTTEGDNTTAVSRTTPSGVDAQAMAEEFARTVQGGKPFEERAVDRYLNALLNSMGERRA